MKGERILRFLSVGQCGFDHSVIARFLHTHIGAIVEAVDTAAQARQRLDEDPFDLVLINRVLDQDGSSGVELIRTLQARPGQTSATPMMLISDLSDAQAAAIAAGAVRGFGKSELSAPDVIERIRSCVA